MKTILFYLIAIILVVCGLAILNPTATQPALTIGSFIMTMAGGFIWKARD